jgi:hypothetical protein
VKPHCNGGPLTEDRALRMVAELLQAFCPSGPNYAFSNLKLYIARILSFVV